ncbi:thioesterase family protein [Notoacmeibacter marinus]|uniref:thioesterase family protein n=1 Tax=Notoacmeibacter marinus TaxID=1876515 RepID=UPI000DF400AD|nr:thioesterase family protein [Notoacmeibacter marinus]
MKPSLKPGLVHEAALTITEELTVPNISSRFEIFDDMPPVFATAFMVAHVEATCIVCIRDHLDDGEHTVGTHVDLSHTAATPVGMTVIASVELAGVTGRILIFDVEVHDEAGPVGSGTHQRTVIDVERFNAKVEEKAEHERSR